MFVLNDVVRLRIKNNEDREIYISLNNKEIIRDFYEKILVEYQEYKVGLRW